MEARCGRVLQTPGFGIGAVAVSLSRATIVRALGFKWTRDTRNTKRADGATVYGSPAALLLHVGDRHFTFLCHGRRGDVRRVHVDWYYGAPSWHKFWCDGQRETTRHAAHDSTPRRGRVDRRRLLALRPSEGHASRASGRRAAPAAAAHGRRCPHGGRTHRRRALSSDRRHGLALPRRAA